MPLTQEQILAMAKAGVASPQSVMQAAQTASSQTNVSNAGVTAPNPVVPTPTGSTSTQRQIDEASGYHNVYGYYENGARIPNPNQDGQPTFSNSNPAQTGSSETQTTPQVSGAPTAPAGTTPVGGATTPAGTPAQTPTGTPAVTTPATGGVAAPAYTGPSIIDYLSSIGQDPSFPARKVLAEANGITGYRGTGPQNDMLLSKLRAQPQGLTDTNKTAGPMADTSSSLASNASPKVDGTGAATFTTGNPTVDGILSGAGFDGSVLGAQSQKSPFNAFADAYKALYQDMGLPTIKQEYEKMSKDYQDLEDKKNKEIQDINEDPWLSAGVRERKVRSINDRYESKMSTLTNRMKNLESLYDKGTQEVQFVANASMQASHNQDVLKQQWALKAIELAQKQADGANDYTLSPGAMRFDSSGNLVAINPKSETSDGLSGTPTSYKEWVLAGSPGTYAQYLASSNVKAPTVAQQTVAEYATRIEQANPIIANLEKSIVGMNIANFTAQLALPSTFQSSEIQQYMQAARNFINAKLRRESGAVISQPEFVEARQQYLPQPGDGPEVLAQKKANRDLVYASLKNAAGTAYQSVDDLLGADYGTTTPPQTSAFDKYTDSITQQGNTSIIPRAVWATVEDKEGLLNYMQSLGYPLFVGN